MALNLMYITNHPTVAQIAESAGVDRIFVDMEYIGKSERQKGLDTVKSFHTFDDVENIRNSISKSQLLVRVNPIHTKTESYVSSEEEIKAVIERGADAVMLPYFHTADEVKLFTELVGGKAKNVLLLETPKAVENLDSILAIKGIDEIHIGINDLSIGYNKKFMFELLADGTVENILNKIKKNGLKYGFGGIASIGKGMIPGENIIMEHYRMGSTRAILSRSFCNVAKMDSLDEVKRVFLDGVKRIREYEAYCESHPELWEENRVQTKNRILEVVGLM